MHFAEKYVARCANLNSPVCPERILRVSLSSDSLRVRSSEDLRFEILGLLSARSIRAIRALIGFRVRISTKRAWNPGSLRVSRRDRRTSLQCERESYIRRRVRVNGISREPQTTRVAARSSADIGVTIDSPASVSKRGVHAREGNALGERRAARQNDCNTISLIGGNEASAQHHVQTLIST